jgi:hypothetical protein
VGIGKVARMILSPSEVFGVVGSQDIPTNVISDESNIYPVSCDPQPVLVNGVEEQVSSNQLFWAASTSLVQIILPPVVSAVASQFVSVYAVSATYDGAFTPPLTAIQTCFTDNAENHRPGKFVLFVEESVMQLAAGQSGTNFLYVTDSSIASSIATLTKSVPAGISIIGVPNTDPLHRNSTYGYALQVTNNTLLSTGLPVTITITGTDTAGYTTSTTITIQQPIFTGTAPTGNPPTNPYQTNFGIGYLTHLKNRGFRR